MEEPDTAGRERGEDEIWRDLVSRLDVPDTGRDEGSPWPPQENVDGWSDAARVIRPADTPAAARDSAGASPGETVTPPADEGDDHYVPPPPPPLPQLDRAAKVAWLALFGGPAYLLVTTIVGWPVPAWAAFCAVAAFVAGFITLVVRMGDGSRDDSDPDNGAVV